MNEPISDRDPVEVLAEEFVERYRRGERPTLRSTPAATPTSPTRSATCSPPWS